MKRLSRFAIVAIFVLVMVLSACLLVACGDNGGGTKQVPVYKGMTISRSIASASASAADDGEHGEYVEPQHKPGHIEGDHDHRDDDFDQDKPFEVPNAPSIENKANSTLDVIGSAESIYYADKNQDIFITIRLSNPDSYEILSFTLNGKKYSNYMFENGSDMENLVLKVNVGDVGGIVEYTIDAIKYVDGTDIKDVRMDGNRTVKAGVRAGDQTYVNVTNEQKSMTSISFDAQVVDLYSLIEKSGGYAKAVLYDGVNMLTKDIKVGEKTNIVFDNLTPNTVYQYGVVALYDNLSGNGAKLNTLYKKAVYTDTIVLFKDVQVGKESIKWGFVWNESFANKQMSAISLWQNGAKVQDVDASATSVDGLKSNNEYTLRATYKNIANQDETIEITFVTYAKAVPTVEIANVQSTQTEISFELNVTDTDNVGAISKIELLHGKDEPIVASDLTARTFENLLSNNDYTVKVTYAYNLNDGVGDQQIVKTANIKTKAKTMPSVTISNLTSTQNTIECDVAYADVDGVGCIESIAFFKGETEVATTSERTHVVFDALECDTEYTLVVTYKYDLNDGKGEQTATQKAKRYTSPQFEFVEATCANTSAVSKGEIIYFEAKVVNPSGVAIERIKINDKYYTPSSGTTKTSIIVNITVEDQFEGGNTALEVTEIQGTLRGQKVSIVPTKSNVANVFVNGELSVKSIKIVDEDGKECEMVVEGKQYYYLVSFKNKTGYSIDSIVIGTTTYLLANDDYIMQDAETAKIPVTFNKGKKWASVTNVKYSNASLGEKSKEIVGIATLVVCVINEVPVVISTAEQLKNMGDWGYYVLGNDLDLAGTEWKDPADFSGYFDGQGYAIKNMNFVGTVENSDFYWGLFNNAYGVIKNIALYGRLIVTMNRTNTTGYHAYVGGFCAEAGDLNIESVANNVNLSVTNNCYGSIRAGGLVGDGSTVTITDSYNTGAVSVTINFDSTPCAGGLVGDGSTVTIMDSYNTGAVSATINFDSDSNAGDYAAGAYAGGLVGYGYSGSTVTITDSYNTGAVSATANFDSDYYSTYNFKFNAGGLVGDGSTVTIMDSYNTGAVSATVNLSSTHCAAACAGGLVGDGSTVTITDSYNTGAVSATGSFDSTCIGDAYVGGLVGYGYSTVTITDSYNTGEVSATVNSHSTSRASGLVGVCYNTVTITDSYYTLPENSYNNYGEKKSSVAEIVAIIKELWDSSVWDFDNLDKNGNPTLKI